MSAYAASGLTHLSMATGAGSHRSMCYGGSCYPAKGLGPRCYDHASKYVSRSGLMAHSGYALINLRELATDLEEVA
jgi:hypothetical protein